MRRTLCTGAPAGLALLLAVAWAPAAAQDWPARPLRMVVAFAAGGPADIVARLLARELDAALGQPVGVENRAGAGGMIGTESVARAPGDGYTLLLTSSAAHGVGPGLWPNLSYDPVADFTHVGLVARGAVALIVHADSPYRSFADFVSAMRASPGKFSYGSGGQGSLGHLTGELVRRAAKIDLEHVPYKGSAPAQADLLGRNIVAISDNFAAHIALIRAGKLRALGVAGARRVEAAPDVPTFAEQGYPDLVAFAWFGLSAPPKLPAPVVARLHAALAAALARAEVQTRLRELGLEAAGDLTPPQYAAFVAAEVKRWSALVKAAGIRAD